MLTAKEALAMKELTDDEKAQKAVERLLEKVKEVAKTQTYIFTGSNTGDKEIWVDGGYDSSMPCWNILHKAYKILHDLGYTTHFFYNERQFVDMFTIVAWGEKTAEQVGDERILSYRSN